MDDQTVGLQHSLFRDIPEFYPVYVTITAWSAARVDGKEVRSKIFQNARLVGHLSKEKIMSKKSSVPPSNTFTLDGIDHEHSDLVVAKYHMTMKLPNVIPIDYSSCEVMIGCEWLTTKDDFIASTKRMRPLIGTAIQEDLNQIAEELGGTPAFGSDEKDSDGLGS